MPQSVAYFPSSVVVVSSQKATAIPARKAEYFDSSEPVQNRVYKSLKVWSMLADLEESLGTFQVSVTYYN